MERHPVVPSRGALSSYSAVAWCYDEIASVYSLGRIRRAKLAHLVEVEPGDRVLYAGVGRGEEAVEAARRGARVTAVDCAPAMLRRLDRRLATEDLTAELALADLFTTDALVGGYDHVVAHFFLNVFAPRRMREALSYLANLVAPGGRLVVADFSTDSSAAYYRPVNVAAWALGLAALHPVYDYVSELAPLGFRLSRRDCFGSFESISAIRL
jgi:demethylmenaquinone methyltransferase/2-methoxy-6-polyprenyl-1,4-benzoquinol methylase